jgi:putative DNA methylase
MTQKYPRRLIEVDLPIKRISAHARAEKDSRLAHIPRLHIYPAARPLAACRAVICAALWPDPADPSCQESFRATAKELIAQWAANHVMNASAESAARLIAVQKNPALLNDNEELRLCLLDFISDFANWNNSTVPSYLKTCRALTRAAHEALGGDAGTRPLVADPFAGGGAIPLEALRIGVDVFAADLNPVAIMIQKVVLEYIPRYGSKLADELLNWLSWVKDHAKDKLCSVYPLDPNGAQPVAYLWARTVLSEAPGETGELPVEVPMLTTMWLARQKNRKRAIRWVRDANGKVKTENVFVRYANGTETEVRRPLLEIFEPTAATEVERGTAARNSATCPVTGYTTQAKRVEAQLKARKGGAKDARLYCVVIDTDGESREFRLPNIADLEALQHADALLRQRELIHDSPISFRPNEFVPVMSGVFNAPIYGHDSWESLFNSRQLLAIASYSALARDYVDSLSDEDQEYRLAVATLLGLIIDRLADLNSALCGWQLNTPNSAHVFTRWALPMIMDFAEVNPLSGAGGSPDSALRRAIAYIRDVGTEFPGSVEVQMCSATKLPLPDDSVSLLATDPPYYDAIPYADLMDFFYVWLRRTIGDLFPAIFTGDTTPKEEEVCEMSWMRVGLSQLLGRLIPRWNRGPARETRPL